MQTIIATAAPEYIQAARLRVPALELGKASGRFFALHATFAELDHLRAMKEAKLAAADQAGDVYRRGYVLGACEVADELAAETIGAA
jgi:hypothetical protein